MGFYCSMKILHTNIFMCVKEINCTVFLEELVFVEMNAFGLYVTKLLYAEYYTCVASAPFTSIGKEVEFDHVFH